MLVSKNVATFIGADATYEEAKVILFGAPFDSTTSYRPGTRFASSSIRKESFGLEIYSPYQDVELDEKAVCDVGDLELPFGNARKALQIIENQTAQIISDNKIPLLIGGEHLVTYGSVKALAQKYPDLHIIHFDAHADLREDYMGEALSHATVLRRCHDLLGDQRIFQFGIRSGDKAEFEFAKTHVVQERFTCNTLKSVVTSLKGKPIYLTVDLDVLDPSQFPATGTPEAGGWDFNTLRTAIMDVLSLNVVGLDVNELNPMLDATGQSTALAGKIIREIIIGLTKEVVETI
ncbi:MAG TPA: agmatinase [Erysipelotrichaceae bacterium]|nr:agmatinase [Erysipelotrichaceae bacterium]